MTRKQWMLIVVAVVLGGLSLYLNRDWFASENIHIYHRSAPQRSFFRRKRMDDPQTNPVIFGFDRKLKLTCIKVIPVSALETNKYALPIWHLVTQSNSVAIKDFPYGSPIPGMHPAVKGAIPDPLEPGVKYRLLIEASGLKGEHDFVTTPRTP
jgi:hypothetical protein